MITFTPDLPLVLGLVASVVLPILVGLVTTRETSASRKAIYLAGLALVAGLVTQLLAALNAGVPFDLFAALVAGGGTFAVAVAVHFGLWKPTGVAARAQSVGTAGKHVAE